MVAVASAGIATATFVLGIFALRQKAAIDDVQSNTMSISALREAVRHLEDRNEVLERKIGDCEDRSRRLSELLAERRG